VAVSDDLALFAHPRPALHAATMAELARQVEALVGAEEAGEVIVGVPIGLSGADTQQTAEARALAKHLRNRLPIPVTEWDERLSTAEATKYGAGRKPRRSGELDSASAAVVLQAVLDSRRGRQ
jgi:putative Holliday junction resolvase